jgi:hypothetical protein
MKFKFGEFCNSLHNCQRNTTTYKNFTIFLFELNKGFLIGISIGYISMFLEVKLVTPTVKKIWTLPKSSPNFNKKYNLSSWA